MDHFISHLPYIIVAAVSIAVIASIWAVLILSRGKEGDQDKASERSETGGNSAERPGCEGCAIASVCMGKSGDDSCVRSD